MWQPGAIFCGLLVVYVCATFVNGQRERDDLNGLFPVVFNLATRARISANATCGETGSEVFCKLVEHVRIFPAENRHCDICDARSSNPLQRHPISNAIDGSNNWWQSPTLTNGAIYNYVTITLDLGQVYQIAYIIIKAANSPRPGNWILDRSVDGKTFKPWQYFAMSDRECRNLYGIEPTIGVPTFLEDDQVICTSRYSALNPVEGGEIFVSLVNNRPGVFQPSKRLLEFTSAKVVRLRFQKIRTLNADLMTFSSIDPKDVDSSVTRRYYYSVKDISIGGQCICYGHASYCRRHDTLEERLQCQCLHNTAGDNCEQCMPLFNQKPWQVGGIQNIGCEECNCHGKADECVYNATIDGRGLSLNMDGKYDGGGVCLNCREYTTGINCERCLDGYYRPRGMTPESRFPCRQCTCQETRTSTSRCVLDDSRMAEGLNPGDCICKDGYSGRSCDSCAFGYYGFPNCRPCRCNAAGSVDPNACDRACICKPNVEGSRCDRCAPGYFNLNIDNPNGCTKCFCFGVSTVCESVRWGLSKVDDLEGWMLSNLQPGGVTLLPRPVGGWLEAKTYFLRFDNIDPRSYSQEDIYYWVAPMTYLGNRLSSYGGYLQFTLKYTLDVDVSNKYHLSEPNLILEGSGMSITSDKEYLRESMENKVRFRMHEDNWKHLADGRRVTREEMMTILYSLNRLMIRATYHTAQDSVFLKDVSLDMASPMIMDGSSLKSVEQCRCPEGYAGLSCESCSPGWRRINDELMGGVCRKCECYGHASECDPATGHCVDCKDSTMGDNCERCLPGFYGDPRRGTRDDCKPCACPLVTGNNFFAERCVAKPTLEDINAYECLNCREGYIGSRCERCAPGFYGEPSIRGGSCRRCNCGGNIDINRPGSCDSITGACIICANNTEGEYCERCRGGYYGSAVNGDCRPCDCYAGGSVNLVCNPRNGQCPCRKRHTGQKCDRCIRGYGNIQKGCVPCDCDTEGSESRTCDPVSGQCRCKPGIAGLTCERCANGFYDFTRSGCKRCNCYSQGTNNAEICDSYNGRCICRPGATGKRCDRCQQNHFGLESTQGCTPCDCNREGSKNLKCDDQNGQCDCKPGVGGRQCDRCQPGYYGFSRRGCKRCEPCNRQGHVCDPVTGKCVCPPNTKGPNCEICVTDGWGYDKDGGCKPQDEMKANEKKQKKKKKKKSVDGKRRKKRRERRKKKNKKRKTKNGRKKKAKRCRSKLCNCSKTGSESQQCDPDTGECACLDGYQGFSCDHCVAGFYNFPNCEECACNKSGVIEDTCITGVCECDGIGQCFCKENVEGRRCDRCRPRTFSLSKDNPKGCTECYCFLRAESCRQAPYMWTDVELPPLQATLVNNRGQGQPMLRRYGHMIINNTETYVPGDITDRPLYWQLPLTGDMVLSYSGKLRFVHYFEGPFVRPGSAGEAPLVVIIGNGIQIETGKSNLEPTNPLQFDISLHEDVWNRPGEINPVTRRVMMVVLQNVDVILVRAVQDGKASYAELGPTSIQRAVPRGPGVTSTELALGVELCECPERYSGESCQNPGPGYFRVRPTDGVIGIGNPEAAIGNVRHCQCYGHSKICHPETGICLNCQHNTTGESCEKCADGLYGVATRGTPDDCQPCACPLPIPSNNFSPSCVGGRSGLMCTDCKEGYTGSRCESCSPGYYGNPQRVGDSCKPCRCNMEGSRSRDCDPVSGQCPCLSGIGGRTCEACTDPTFGVEDGECVSCYTGCTGILLSDLANMSVPLIKINITGAAYPWERLYAMEKEANILRDKLAGVESAGVEEFKQMKRKVERYHDLADKLIDRSHYTCDAELGTTGTEACKAKERAAEILKNATEVEKEVKKTFNDVKDLVEGLDELVERLLYNQSGVNMSKALENAKKILDEILGRDFKSVDAAIQEENRLAELLSERIADLYDANFNGTDVEIQLEDVKDRLDDLVRQTRKAGDTAEEALDKIRKLKDLLARLTKIKDEIIKMHEDSKGVIDEAEDLLTKADTNLITSSGQHGLMTVAIDQLAKKVNDLKTALPGLEQLATDAFQHALDLRKQAEEIDRLFGTTRDYAERAVKAAKAYKSIVDAINEAKKSANEALKAAQESTEIAKVEDLRDEVERLIRKSGQQDKEAEDLLDDAQGLANTLSNVKDELDKGMDKHGKNRDLLNEIKRKLDLLPSDFFDRLSEVERKNKEAKEIAKNALDLVKKINNTMGPKMDELKKFDIKAFNFDVASEIARAKAAEEDTRKLSELEEEVEKRATKAIRKISDMHLDLDSLKAKIRDARSRVNDMKMSLQADGQCYRSYRSPLMPSSTNELRFGFMLNNTVSDMLMVLMQQSPQEGGEEFLAAEIRNEKVRLSWNSGKGQGSVSHDQRLEPNKWYQVVAKRIGSVGQLKVWNIEEGTEKDTNQEVASMGAGCALMNLNENSTIFMAGSSDLYQIPLDITRKNFVGCLGEVFVDSSRIGVYNFKTNEKDHCGACKEVPQIQLGSSKVYVFEGRGFASFLVRGYSSKRTKVELEFKTFWENSRIFFVGNPTLGDFFSIELKDGRVAVRFNMGGRSAGSGNTVNTYNNNQWTKITFDRRRLKAVLKVGSETIAMSAPGPSDGLDLSGAPMYFGGVPTNLKTDGFRDFNKTEFFYGCMRNLNFGTLPPDDDSSTLVNVQATSGCRENGIHNVDFRGDGYLILQSEHTEFASQQNDISLTFVTRADEAVLMLVRDIPGENYYSISMVDGKLEARIRADGSEPVIIKSNERFNDGKMHCVSLIKDGRDLQLIVNDNVLGSGEAQDVTFNNVGDLYLGGSPIDLYDLAATDKKMDGCISDVIANGVLLSMSEAKQYKLADVGRCRLNMDLTSPVVAPKAIEETTTTTTTTTTTPTTTTTSEMPSGDAPVSCAFEKSFTLEDDAKSVANAATFFAEVAKVKKKELAKSFEFNFDFRTFYPNGLFGYLTNDAKSFYFGIQLRDSKLEVAYVYQGPVRITFEKSVADGQWHSVYVKKDGDILSIKYDNEKALMEPIQRRIDIKVPMFLGGPGKPEDFTDYGIDLVTHSIRGCIRSLQVNGININITDTQVIQDVGGCYKNVEPGVFFDGEAWGVYDTDFVIEPQYTIRLEFRTTSQDGILISGNRKLDYGLTLELHRGQVKLSLKNSAGLQRAETKNDNEYLYCDNKWHSVRAGIVNGELTVVVDNGPKAVASMIGTAERVELENPLFIGGFAGGFDQSASSLSLDMFYGCIRNLVLNGKTVDWYALPNSQNMRKTACPVS